MDAAAMDSRISEMELKGISQQADRIYAAQQKFFASGATRPVSFRLKQLKILLKAIEENESLLNDALYKDLRKSAYETYGTEIGPVLAEIRHACKNLKDWMRKERVATPMIFFPSSSYIIRDPLGTVLTIGPWNYPFLLIITSVVNAIAGGNTVILKPSDEAVHTADVIEKIISENFAEEFLAVIQVPGPLVTKLIIDRYHFDHIFFTGSTRVGRIIMASAAAKLSPVTLELGGKSPCIVEADADLNFAAKKIAWSKTINAGQTCVAPDYLFVHASVKEKFLEKLKAELTKMFGEDPQSSPDFPRIINKKRFEVLSAYLEDGRIVYGGQKDELDLFIAPTIIEGIDINDPVMQEEIFGPVLPVFTFSGKQEVLEMIAKHPYPLALYIYTRSRANEKFYVDQVRFGGGCINNGVIHLGNPDLPFGGTGFSGIGQYHGHAGFLTFTRPKSIIKSPTWFDVPLWYPPYAGKLKWLKRMFRM